MTIKHYIISAGLVLGFAAATWSQLCSQALTLGTANAAVEIPKVSVDDVERLMADSTVRIFDANSKSLYAKGHVPGAVNLGFDAVSEKTLPADKATKLIFYCMNEMCSASVEAARKASALGYSNVLHMAAGIKGWIKAGKPVESATRDN